MALRSSSATSEPGDLADKLARVTRAAWAAEAAVDKIYERSLRAAYAVARLRDVTRAFDDRLIAELTARG